jgi:hypothetical protein
MEVTFPGNKVKVQKFHMNSRKPDSMVSKKCSSSTRIHHVSTFLWTCHLNDVVSTWFHVSSDPWLPN